MTVTLAHQLNLETIECCSCGTVFAMQESIRRRRLNDGGWFYCPNGHQQHYSKSETDRLRDKLAEQTRQATALAERAKNAENVAAKATTELKRIKKRMHAGVCPCCNRTFQNLQRHMATKHKDEAP